MSARPRAPNGGGAAEPGLPPVVVTVPSAAPSPFERLEAQTRKVQWTQLALVAAVAVLPALAVFVVAIGQIRSDAERHARHVASVAGNAKELDRIAGLLDAELRHNELHGLEALDPQGRHVLTLGTASGPGTITVTVPLGAAGGRLRLHADYHKPFRRALRVLAIHLAMAGVLALVIYRVPMRALRQAVQEIRDTHAKLVHSDKLCAIGEMYASLTHEINNPLGIIVARVKFMLSTSHERGFPADLVRDLEVIDRHGGRIAEIVRSLLAFARKTDFTLTETDLNRIIRDVVLLVERPFAKQGIRIQTLLGGALPPALCSAPHLQQVFLNLLNNARDAMPDGGLVTLTTFHGNGRLVAEVTDSGTGIAPEHQSRIFEPFFTTKDVGKGTGLGLSVSYGIIKAHGGELTVESEPRSGAVFRIVLPAGTAR